MKKCRNCSELFNPFNSLQKYCLKKECVETWVSDQKEKDWKKKKVMVRQQIKTTRDHLKELQKIFNKYIRLRDKNELCISCQKTIVGVKHASHYLSAGGHSMVRFNEDNVWVSCYKCNVMLSGNQIEYRKALISKIGKERVEWLENNGNLEKKWTKEELQNLITLYKQKCKELEYKC